MASNYENYPLLDTDEELDDDDVDDFEAWDDWNADENEQNDIEDSDSVLQCLFCDSKFSSCETLFQHCCSTHHFNFSFIRKSFKLDFYGCFKLFNYIRATVAQNTCWSCGHQCNSNQELLNHLHETKISEELKHLWDADKFLQPFLEGDALLYSFDQDEDFDEDECMVVVDEEELAQLMGDAKNICFDEVMVDAGLPCSFDSNLKEHEVIASTSMAGSSRGNMVNGLVDSKFSAIKKKDSSARVCVGGGGAASEIKKVNESYFGSYSSFGIHREMLTDKVRMDAYSQAILKNPALFSGAIVMDVGCGTGILSLFAAQAGASRVMAVDGSEKMAAVASQIVKDNGYLRESICESKEHNSGVVEVIYGMIEDLVKSIPIEPHSIDVLLSEWMGYCLLYESMLSSVLVARDRWLKPGGAILPDTATMFVAGFGRGCTSLPFWENVYGFDMSSVGKELVKDAAKIPIVDVVSSEDIVTHTAILKNFDLVTMKIDDMDFTSSIELLPKSGSETKGGLTWCHGVVLWFDTGFTSRFCKEVTANLSTSPYTQKTHWSQTILTFSEPIALSSEHVKNSAAVGTESCPALKIDLRISIVRAPEHRAIDISVETSAVSHSCQRRAWPVQIFNLS